MTTSSTQILPSGRSFLSSRARIALRCALAAVPAATLPEGVLAAEEDANAGPPAFIRFDQGAVLPARVYEVVSTDVTDLVLVPAGYNAGYRPGMVCRVSRAGDGAIAEILMVEVRKRVSAGLIVSVFSDQIIEPGDVVRVKAVREQN